MIEVVLHRHRDVRFMIHGIVKGSDAEGDQPIFDALSTMGDRVVVRQDVLSEHDYAADRPRRTFCCCPTIRRLRRTRFGGVHGCPRSVYPSSPRQAPAFAGPAFERGWGVGITEYSAPGVAAAVLTALGGLEALSSPRRHRRPARPDDTLDVRPAGDCRSTARADTGVCGLAGRARRLIRKKFSSPAVCADSRCTIGPYAAILA